MTASRTSRRPAGARPGRIAAAIALAAGLGTTLALTGCSAGQITQTGNQVPAVPGVNAQAGNVALRNLVIAYDGPEGYPAGGDAPLVVRLFNTGTTTVTLVGVTAERATSVTLVGTPVVVTTTQPPPPPTETAAATAAPTGSPEVTATASPEPTPTIPPTTQPPGVPVSVAIPPGSFVLLVPGQGDAGFLRLNGLTQAIAPGESVRVTFSFSDGTSTTLDVPLAPPLGTVPRATPVVAPEHAQAEHS